MARIKEYPSITSFDGTNDALAIEQTDGANNRLRKVSPAQLKQYMEAGDFEVTGEVKDGNGNILSDVAEQLGTAGEQIENLIKFKDVTLNASTDGYTAPSSTAGGVWIESLASYEAIGVSREKIIGIIPVDWSSISQPFSFYLGSTSIRAMLHNTSSIYSSNVSYVKIRVVYHS